MAQLNTKIALRNDSSANWSANESTVLSKGEVGVEFINDNTTKIKIGDGIKTWSQLGYVGGSEAKDNQVLTASSVDELPTENLIPGDMAIVITSIGETSKNSYTGYVWNGTAWTAMDGNYNANNVYFGEDMMVTTNIGYITTSNGSGTIPSAGKNLTEVFEAMFVKEEQPNITNPSVSITSSQVKAYEVGTRVTPSYSTSFSAGSYTYGPETGVVPIANEETDTGYVITDSNNNTSYNINGSFSEIEVTETTNYKMSAKVYHSNGTQPLTNKGNVSTKSAIAAGYVTNNTGAITGYRNWFCGYKAEGATIDVASIDSAAVRALENKTNGSFKTSISANKMQQMFFAAPAGKVASIAIVDQAKIPQNVMKKTVSVEGANGYTAIDYDLFYVSNATAASGANTYTITVTKA